MTVYTAALRHSSQRGFSPSAWILCQNNPRKRQQPHEHICFWVQVRTRAAENSLMREWFLLKRRTTQCDKTWVQAVNVQIQNYCSLEDRTMLVSILHAGVPFYHEYIAVEWMLFYYFFYAICTGYDFFRKSAVQQQIPYSLTHSHRSGDFSFLRFSGRIRAQIKRNSC